MSVRVEGIRKEQVEIEVTPEALLRGLQEHFGIAEIFTPRGDTYWKMSDDMFSIIEMKQMSYHGSPRYEATGRVISDERKLAAWVLLKELQRLLEGKL